MICKLLASYLAPITPNLFYFFPFQISFKLLVFNEPTFISLSKSTHTHAPTLKSSKTFNLLYNSKHGPNFIFFSEDKDFEIVQPSGKSSALILPDQESYDVR